MISVLVIALTGLYWWHLAGNEKLDEEMIVFNGTFCYYVSLFFLICFCSLFLFGGENIIVSLFTDIAAAVFWYLLYRINFDCLVERAKKQKEAEKQKATKVSENDKKEAGEDGK